MTTPAPRKVRLEMRTCETCLAVFKDFPVSFMRECHTCSTNRWLENCKNPPAPREWCKIHRFWTESGPCKWCITEGYTKVLRQ